MTTNKIHCPRNACSGTWVGPKTRCPKCRMAVRPTYGHQPQKTPTQAMTSVVQFIRANAGRPGASMADDDARIVAHFIQSIREAVEGRPAD